MLKNRIVYLLFFLFWLIITSLYKDPIIQIVLVFLILFPIISYILLRINFWYLNFKITSSNKYTYLNEEIKFTITIINDSKIPFIKAFSGLSFHHNLTRKKEEEKLYFNILNNSKKEFEIGYVSDCCGSVEIIMNDVKVFDFLRITSCKYPLDKSLKISILPKLSRIPLQIKKNYYDELEESDNYSETAKTNYSEEIANIRGYLEGDNLKKIHWKLSFKNDELMVKEYSKQIVDGLLLFNEFRSLSDQSFSKEEDNKLFKFQLDLAFALLENNITFSWGFKVKNSSEIFIKPINTFEDIINTMEIMFKEAVETDDIALRTYNFEKEKFGRMIYFTLRKDYTITQELINARKNSIITCVLSGQRDEELDFMAFAQSLDIEVINVKVGEDECIKEIAIR